MSPRDDLKTKNNFFKRKFPSFRKKTTELSVLCGNSVGFICYGPDDDVHVWPEPQDHPQALPEIVGKFNALSDHMRMSKACDLFDFPNLEGLSPHELGNHLVNLDSHILGIRQKKFSILRRGNSKKPKRKETDHLIRVSDNATISNRKVVASSDDRLGFDELGYVSRGSHKTVNSCSGSFDAVKVSPDVGVSDSFPLYPLTFPGDFFFPVDLDRMDFESLILGYV